MAEDAAKRSRRYQDYVIRDGRFVGAFDEMYRYADEVPWHQDETACAIFSDFTVAIVRHRKPSSLLDGGCGLGFVTARLQAEVPSLSRVAGLDVSPAAIEQARARFPGIEFAAGTVADAPITGPFEMVVSKDVLWYVLDDLRGYWAALSSWSARWVYIGQSFPATRPFLGDHLLPDANGLISALEAAGHCVVYSAVERDAHYGGREYAHVLLEITR